MKKYFKVMDVDFQTIQEFMQKYQPYMIGLQVIVKFKKNKSQFKILLSIFSLKG